MEPLLALALGALAVALPFALSVSKRAARASCPWAALVSHALAMASLACVILYLRSEATAGDLAAIADTVDAFLYSAGALIVLVTCANVILFVRAR